MKNLLWKGLYGSFIGCALSLSLTSSADSRPATEGSSPWIEGDSHSEFVFVRQDPQTPWSQIVRESLSYPLPQKVPLTSSVGMRVHPMTGKNQFHYGVDLVAPRGTPILAAFSGEVLYADQFGGLGKVVILQHPEEQVTRYAHMSKMAVSVGQKVQQGEVIGYVGATGQAQVSHLHFEWWQRQGPTDRDWVVFDPSVLWK